MKSKSTLLVLALAVSSASAWSCSKSDTSTPAAADSKPAAPATAPAAAAPAPAVASAAVKVEAPKPAPAVATTMKAAASMTAPAPAATPVGSDARSDIKTAIPEAIRLLEAKDYTNFIKNFMPPSQLAQMPVPVDQLAALMMSDPKTAEQFNGLIDALKKIQSLTPTMDASGNKATFTLDPPIAGEKELSLVKENGLWYLGD
jgi:hypothetical protein